MTASEMGKKRWAGVSDSERSEQARSAVAARNKKLGAKRRAEIAKKASEARWKKAKKQ